MLCASVLWPEVDCVTIASDLLAPIDSQFTHELKTRRFQYVSQSLTRGQVLLVGRFLKYFLAREVAAFEHYFSASHEEISAAIDQYWGNLRVDGAFSG
jgi:hypothetical protein